MAVGTDEACGSNKPLVVENSWHGYIQSPNYPNNYPNRVDCIWKIMVIEGTRMTIHVDDVQVENTYVEFIIAFLDRF